jgi:hypothetical protein
MPKGMTLFSLAVAAMTMTGAAMALCLEGP